MIPGLARRIQTRWKYLQGIEQIKSILSHHVNQLNEEVVSKGTGRSAIISWRKNTKLNEQGQKNIKYDWWAPIYIELSDIGTSLFRDFSIRQSPIILVTEGSMRGRTNFANDPATFCSIVFARHTMTNNKQVISTPSMALTIPNLEIFLSCLQIIEQYK